MVRLNGEQMREKLEKLLRRTEKKEIGRGEKERGFKVNERVS